VTEKFRISRDLSVHFMFFSRFPGPEIADILRIIRMGKLFFILDFLHSKSRTDDTAPGSGDPGRN